MTRIWESGYTPRVLQSALYGDLIALASDPYVQAATTVSDMFVRSRIPREYWYEPPVIKPVKIEVPREVRDGIATRMTAARDAGLSRTTLSRITGMTGSALWRAEHDRLHPDEVEPLQKLLDDLERNDYRIKGESS